MKQRCPVCGQQLPKGVDRQELHRRAEHLAADAVGRAKTQLRRELDAAYRRRLNEEREHIRRSAIRDAAAATKVEVAGMRRQLKDTEQWARKEIDRAERRAAQEVAKQSRREIELLKERSAKERAQHIAEAAQLKSKIDALSLKLERRTSEELGADAEVSVFGVLKAAFPMDRIERIGRGVRGADVLQHVMVDGKEVGRIVYECKNVATWSNEWIGRAKRYRSEYQTQWVVLASRVFPRRQKWFVVEKGVPVIDLRLTAKLAEIIRGAVVEAGRLRATSTGRQTKAHQLFDYIVSDHFTSRFRAIADAMGTLREHQDSERQWHENAWAKQLKLYSEVEGRRREIGAQLKSITDAAITDRLRVVSG